MSAPTQRFSGGRYASSRRTVYVWWLIWLLWLPFFIPVAGGFWRGRPDALRLALSIPGALAFFGLYVWMGHRNAVRLASPVPVDPPSGARQWGPVAAVVVLATGLVLLNGQEWGPLFIYAAACLGGWLPFRQAVSVVILLVAIAALGLLAGMGIAQYVSNAAFILIPGMTVVATTRSVATSQHLRAERAELERQAAVSAERLRIARDLHDVLGHDLARIALRSEVAEYLAAAAPEQAAVAMHEVADAARHALREVRAVVAGYRQPTLAGELRAAREILGAAGIQVTVDRDAFEASPAVESTLAWALREAVTNTVKHSHAARCTVRLARETSSLSLEVVDDGAALDRDEQSPAVMGSGLAGLRERLAAVGGLAEAGPLPGGGFRLWVSVPTDPATSTVESLPA
ncbi:MAG TPA: sensor histidine kinase [Thermomicrobiaceae bacterium]|nr:sensor histidine kinase [Thermomicrobiaceae bacterium]